MAPRKSKEQEALPSSPSKKSRRTGKAAGTAGAQPSAPLNLDAVLSPSILAPETRAGLRETFSSAQPFPHCVIPAISQPDVLLRVREEIVNNIEATYKESDLFKVLQTGDLGNLDRLDAAAAAKLPTLMALKNALYSPEFRAMVREITRCGELADKTDCSCNVYAHGGHLLCHDDVIGTRRVSYIIYLTDPEEPWLAEDGGALELYAQQPGQPFTPAVHPETTLLPLFNTMAMFTVLPGRSFHSVQEVFAKDKPRMSISGWYHAPQEPEDAAHASLQQLQAKPATAATEAAGGAGSDEQAAGNVPQLTAGQDNSSVQDFAPFTVPSTSASSSDGAVACPPSESDLAFLIRYLNPVYLSDAAWPKVAAKFAEAGSLQLQNFLSRSWAQRIAAATQAADAEAGVAGGRCPAYTAGVHGGWQPVGPPHKQRYLAHTPAQQHAQPSGAGSQPGGSSAAAASAAADPGQQPHQPTTGGEHSHGDPEGHAAAAQAGALMAQLRSELFASQAFARLLHAMTTLTLLGQKGEVRRFRPGLDYTVAHFGIVTKDPRLDAVLCFVSDTPPATPLAGPAPPPSSSPAATQAPAGDGSSGNGTASKQQKPGNAGKAGKAGKASKAGKAGKAGNGGAQQLGPAAGAQGSSQGGDALEMSPWEDGEVGGFEAYLLADDDSSGADAADVYRQDQEESGVLNVSAAHNSFNLVLRDEGLMRFVKYVSAAAPSSRWDIAMEYLPEDDSDDEDEPSVAEA